MKVVCSGRGGENLDDQDRLVLVDQQRVIRLADDLDVGIIESALAIAKYSNFGIGVVGLARFALEGIPKVQEAIAHDAVVPN
jgi:hypothetical protein